MKFASRFQPLFFLLIFALFAITAKHAMAAPQHGIAMHGTLKHPADFTHFSFANPDAP